MRSRSLQCRSVRSLLTRSLAALGGLGGSGSKSHGTRLRHRIRTAQVTSQHEIQHEETVLVVLEGISEVDDERMIDLTQGSCVSALRYAREAECGEGPTSSRSLRS